MDIELLNPWQNSARKSAYKLYANVVRPSAPNQFVFILAHMRSGSSLLTRILSAHQEICGYGELHLDYSKKSDFQAAIGKLLFREYPFMQFGNERYALDKLLHNYQLETSQISLLTDVPSRIIFLLREPHGTLASQISVLGQSEAEAIDYYVSRLAYLETCVRHLSQEAPCLYLSYSQILNQTEITFQALQNFLELSSQLTEDYKIPDRQVKNHNDPSPTLLAGTILRNRQKPHTNISTAVLRQATEAYERYQSVLATHCLPIPEPIATQVSH